MRDSHLLWSDVKARHDRMGALVETMMIADSLRLTAHGSDEDEMRIVKGLPKAKAPHQQESLQRRIAGTDRQIDPLVYELYGVMEDEIRIAEGGFR